jgi:hypothetical protein
MFEILGTYVNIQAQVENKDLKVKNNNFSLLECNNLHKPL